MARILELNRHAWQYLLPMIKGHGLKQFNGFFHIFDRVERLSRVVLGCVMAVGVLGFFGL